MRRSWAQSLVAVCLLHGATPAGAQPDAGLPDPPPEVQLQPLPEAHQPQVTVTLEPKELLLGQLLKVRIEASVPEGDDVTVAQQALDPFEVHDRRRIVEPAKDGRQRFVFELALQSFDPITTLLPPIALRVVTRDGIVGNAMTEPQGVKVRSLLANEPDAKPRPPAQPVTVMEDDYTLLWILGAILAILLVAALTLLIQRYLRRRPKVEPPPPPPRPPWEIATEKLARLRKRKQKMLEDGQGVQFVDEVSDTVRQYLGGCFGFEGLDRTTEEMLQQLRSHRANPGLQREVAAYLGRCDLVKFAKVDPDQDEADLIFAKAQDIVQFSMPLGTDMQGPDAQKRSPGAADAPTPGPAATTELGPTEDGTAGADEGSDGEDRS